MEVTYENVAKWFDGYFKEFNKSAGPLETTPKMQKFYAPDLEFWMYTAPGFVDPPMSREGLLMNMLHPGLHEELTPQYYVIDLKRMIAVIQFQIQFTDKPSGKVWPARQASAHYHLALDENKELKVKKIQYWTEISLDNDTTMMDLWNKYRDEALTKLGNDWIKAKASS